MITVEQVLSNKFYLFLIFKYLNKSLAFRLQIVDVIFKISFSKMPLFGILFYISLNKSFLRVPLLSHNNKILFSECDDNIFLKICFVCMSVFRKLTLLKIKISKKVKISFILFFVTFSQKYLKKKLFYIGRKVLNKLPFLSYHFC